MAHLRWDSTTGALGIRATLGDAVWQTRQVDDTDFYAQRALVWLPSIPIGVAWGTLAGALYGGAAWATNGPRDRLPGWTRGDVILQVSLATDFDPGGMYYPTRMYSVQTYVYRYGPPGGRQLIAATTYYGLTEPTQWWP
jgi:hypothetical protein